MTFKQRWKHMFTTEDGPDDAAAAWRDVSKLTVEAVDWQALLP